VLGEAVQLLVPLRILLRLLEIEQAGVQHVGEVHLRKAGLDDPCRRIEGADDFQRSSELARRSVARLVEHDHVGEFDLLDQQVDEAALVVVAKRFPALPQEVGGGIILTQVHRIDDGHHRVEPRDVGKACAVVVAKIERRGNRKRLGDAGRFDQQVIEAAVLRQRAHFVQQVFAQGAADAAVGHLDQFLICPREIGAAVADEVGIDVHLAHVVDEHRDLQPLPVVQDMIHQRRFPRAEESGQNGDGQFSGAGRRVCEARGAGHAKNSLLYVML
jgi:hypothetical protein